MAYDWIRIDTDVVDHPKVIALAKALKNPTAGWFLIRAWAWTKRFAPSGIIPSDQLGAFERGCGWRGTTGRLTEVLASTYLLTRLEDGSYEVHDWQEKQGKIAEQAAKAAERQRKHRYVTRDVTHTVTRDVTPHETRRDGRDVTDETNNPLPPSSASPTPAPHELLQDVWNTNKAIEQPQWRETSTKRKAAACARFKERSLEEWAVVVRRIAASDFCRGATERGTWVAGPDFLLRPDTAAKVLEGSYDNRATRRGGDPSLSLFGTGPIVATEEQF